MPNALSVSSHVTHGYVGNRAVVFPLQCYGWNVDAIHTTDFSNHPGYGQFRGSKTEPHVVKDIFDGLRSVLDLQTEYSLILVGYCPSAQVMATIYEEITPLLKPGARSSPVLVVDPVLGDNGRLYVPQEIVDVHADFLKLGLVELTTPNQFELELLTGVTMDTWASVKHALLVFHSRFRVPNVVLSSVIIDGEMHGVGFCEGDEPTMFRISIPTINCRFSGCGDVFTALITHAFYENNCRLTPDILGQALAKLRRILTISYEEERARIGSDPAVVQDVRLIQSRHVFEEISDESFEVKYL